MWVLEQAGTPACLVWSILGWGGMERGRLWGFPPQGRFSRLAGLKPTHRLSEPEIPCRCKCKEKCQSRG